MDRYSKNFVYVKNIKKVIDSGYDLGEIKSNFFINLNMCNGMVLPDDSKIKIINAKLEHSICKCNKEIFINGIKVNTTENLLEDCMLLNEDSINIHRYNNNEILITIVEKLALEIESTLYIEAVAYLGCGNKVIFSATGKAVDCINLIFNNKSCVLYNDYKCDKIYIETKNKLSTDIDPDFIFLSPVFDCNSNISGFIGNVFIDYKVDFGVEIYKQISKNKYIYI